MNKANLNAHNIKPVDNDFIFLFDIDDTLYKSTEEMEQEEMEKWKNAYEHFKGDKTDVPDFIPFLNSTTLYSEAFKLYFGKHPFEVEKFKGFLEYNKYVSVDETLKSFFKKFPFRKWCFTNGMKCRAEPILKCMELTNTFEGVICMDNECQNDAVLGKPKKEAYEFVEKLLNIKDKSKVFFFDDSKANIEMGIKMGWRSYLIKKEDYIVDILKSIMKEIFEEMER